MANALRPGFIPLMECLAVDADEFPTGAEWTYEIKWEGCRIEAVKTRGAIKLYSRLREDFTNRFPHIAGELRSMPNDTVIDGVVVALDADGYPNPRLLQSGRAPQSRVIYMVFDILLSEASDLTQLDLVSRRNTVDGVVGRMKYVRASKDFSLAEILSRVKTRGREGVVAKKRYRIYQPGQRTGLWAKQRLKTEQEFVIGGYIPGVDGIGSILIGVRKEEELQFVASVRAGFVSATRRIVLEEIKRLVVNRCPFVNLADEKAGRLSAGLTVDKMKQCIWVKPSVVVQVKFREWSGDRLMQATFVRLRDDKVASEVVRET